MCARLSFAALAIVLWFAAPVQAQYTQRFPDPARGYPTSLGNATGAVTFIGNTLGLAKAPGQNQPGIVHSQGAFISRFPTDQVGTYPPGTTLDYTRNGSTAELLIPPGAQVVYAELIWSGTHGYCSASATILAQATNPIVFITPAGQTTVTGDVVTAKNDASHYVRSADVTALVQAGGPGTYLAGSIPSTICAGEDTSNAAGWTLAVVYHEGTFPTRNLTVFVGLEPHNGAAASVAGFCTPGTGTLAGRLAVTAAEGDASASGPTMRFGPTAALPDSTRLSGPNNRLTNFFSSQINGDIGTLVTTGSFGTVNHSTGPSGNVSGGRQGWDITNVNVSAQLVQNQSVAFAKGTSTGDAYRILGLGLQINVLAPAFQANGVLTVDRPVGRVGDTLTYTALVRNTVSGGITADNIIFTRTLAPGTSFVPNSVTIDSVPVPGANPDIGVPLGSIAGGSQKIVTYQILVDAIPTPPVVRGDVSWTYEYTACASAIPGSFQPNTAGPPGGFGAADTALGVVRATKSASLTSPSAGQVFTYTVAVDSIGTADATNVAVQDPIPAGVQYLAGTTRLNSVPVPDVGGAMPFAGGALVNSPGAPPGTIVVGARATVTFDVRVNNDPSGSAITNVATIEPDGPGGQPTYPVEHTLTATSVADIEVDAAVSNPTPTVGSMVTFTITAANLGPSGAAGLSVAAMLPAGLSFVGATPSAGSYDQATGHWLIGALPTGQSVTLLIDAVVGLPGSITLLAIKTGASVPDPNTANDSAAAAINAVAHADVALSKHVDNASPAVGSVVTFTIAVANHGPSAATDLVITDVLPAGMTLMSATESIGGYNETTGAWTISTLAQGVTGTLTIAARIDAATTLVNTARVTSLGVLDLNPINDASSVTLFGVATANVRLTKSVSRPEVLPGEDVSFLITAINDGPSAAGPIAVSDLLPAGLVYFGSRASQGTYDPTTGLWDGIFLDASQAATLEIVALVNPAGSDTFLNTASIVADPSAPIDPQPGDNTASAVVTTVPVADISISIASPGTASVGEEVTWMVRVDNLGPSSASGVRTLVTLPPGLSLTSATPSLGTFDATTGEWLIPALSLGQTASLALITQVTQGGQIVLEASRITSAPVDPVVANNQSAAALQALSTADIQVQLNVDDDTPSVGQTVQLTLRVRNAGPAHASGLVVTMPIPAGLSVTQATAGAGSYDSSTGVWTIGALPVGSEIILTVLAQVTASSPITVLAQTSALVQTDPIEANNQAGVALQSVAADVQVVKTSDQANPTEGARIRFRIIVTNNGPIPATSVIVNDSLPTGLLYVSHVASQGTYSPVTGAWAIGSIAPSGDGAFATLDITTVVRGSGSVSNVATLAGLSEVDLIAANNVDERAVSAHIWSTFFADLVLDAQVSPGVASPGGMLTYTLVANNRGPTYVIDESISGQLPNNTTFVSLTPSADGSCTAPTVGGTGPFTCTWLGHTLLEEGTQRTATLTVRVGDTATPGSIITGQFTVNSPTPDYYPPSNTDIVSVSVADGLTPTDLTVSGLLLSEGVIGSALAVPIGIPTPVRFTVTNNGPGAVTIARYLIEIPAIDLPAVQVRGVTLSQGAAAVVGVSSAEWTLGPLASGASATFDLTIVLSSMRSTTIATRRVGSTPADANAANDRAEVILDGVGASAGGERSLAVGNIDGSGGSEIVVGAGRGETPLIRIYSSTGTDTGTTFLAYNRGFEGGVRVATCDVDADGIDEIIAAPGPGPGPHVRVLSVRGRIVEELVGFYALDPSYPYGLYPACADVDGDGFDDVILGAGEGGPPQVLAFAIGRSRVSPIAAFLTYEPGFIGGVRVAAVKTGQPGASQFRIVTAPGPGRPLEVRTWQVQGTSATLVRALPLTGPEYQLGAFPQVGDLNGDGALEVVLGAGAGAPPLIAAVTIPTGQFLGVAQMFPATFLGGVRIAVGDLEGDGQPELLVAPGLGGRPIVDVYSVSGAGLALRFRLTPIEIP